MFEDYENGHNIVEGVEVVEDGEGNVGACVKTKDGNDIVLSSFDGNTLSAFGKETNSSVTVELYNKMIYVSNLTSYTSGKTKILEESTFKWRGVTEAFKNENSDSWFVIEGVNPQSANAVCDLRRWDRACVPNLRRGKSWRKGEGVHEEGRKWIEAPQERSVENSKLQGGG